MNWSEFAVCRSLSLLNAQKLNYRRGGTVANPYSQNMTLDTMNSNEDSTAHNRLIFQASILVFSSKGEKNAKKGKLEKRRFK